MLCVRLLSAYCILISLDLPGLGKDSERIFGFCGFRLPWQTVESCSSARSQKGRGNLEDDPGKRSKNPPFAAKGGAPALWWHRLKRWPRPSVSFEAPGTPTPNVIDMPKRHSNVRDEKSRISLSPNRREMTLDTPQASVVGLGRKIGYRLQTQLPAATKTRPSLDQTINWFHQIDLPDGTVTPGIDRSQQKLTRLKLPDLRGKTFLDIGAWDGFFSFEAERRGASRVLATDSVVWEGRVPGYSKAGFLCARARLGSRVEDLQIDAFELCPETVGLWDVTLLAGVLYHVRDPWLLLNKAASVTRELLIVETVTSLRFWPLPAISIYGSGFRGDPTNFCAPNIAALKVILRDCGFPKVQVVSRSSLRHRRCVVHANR